jgi:hypothetical protein
MSVELFGKRDLDRAMRRAGEAVTGFALRDTIGEGAELLRQAFEDAAPNIIDNALAKGMKAEITGSRHQDVEATVGPVKRVTGLAFIAEYGAQPHPIAVRRKSGKLALASEDTVFGRAVQHPGSPPQPFMRPTWDTHKERIYAAMRSGFWRRITVGVR